MNVLKNKFMRLMKNDKGASNVEIIVWISVVLIIATVLFGFSGSINNWIKSAGNTITSMKQN